MKNFEELLKAVEELRALSTRQVGRSGREQRLKELRNKIKTLAVNVRQMSDAREEEDEQPDFEEFLTIAGRSMISAQQQLDLSTGEYLKSVSKKDYVLPTTFRLPKVAGELKFAMEFEKRKRRGLIFVSKSETESESMQQSLRFEIIGAPPPPEIAQKLKESVPKVEFVLAPQLRVKLFDFIREKWPNLAGARHVLNFDRNWENPPHQDTEREFKVLVVPLSTEGVLGAYLLGFANDEGLGVWHLTTAAGGESFKAAQSWILNDRFKPIRDLMIELSAVQHERLTSVS